jgi:hypothetical protein
MARVAKNELTIEAHGSSFRLFGYVGGQHIRKRGSYDELATKRAELLNAHAARRAIDAALPSPKMTRLTYEQLADAEAAVAMADGRRLVEYVQAGKRVLPPMQDVLVQHARDEWLATLKTRKRSSRTAEKNRLRVDAFTEATGVTKLPEITPLMIERYVFRKGVADFTRLTDAQVLRAWLNFCVQRRWLAVSPFEVDTKDLKATARPTEAGRILTPDQSHALLAASRDYRGGVFIPYCVLTLWCFMRESEAQRVTRAAMKIDGAKPVIEVDTKKRRTASYRSVNVPACVLPVLRASTLFWPANERPFYTRRGWEAVRERAGLLDSWQPDITRHSGISYLYQRSGDIKDVCRQAGNTSDVSFRHYLTLPAEGACDAFFAILP